MPTTLEKCDEAIRELMNELIEDHYPDLREAEAKIELLAARNPKGPPVKLHGYPCAATVKVNSYKDRVEGKDDATITIDIEAWETTPDDRRRALLDHELYHLLVKRKTRKRGRRRRRGGSEDLDPVAEAEVGTIARDDLGRPVLKVRLHDLVVGGFTEIIKRHKDAALEVGHIQHCVDQAGQYLMFEHEKKKGTATKNRETAGAAA